ncbi:MAG: HipA N-terminal domain-containing protein [Bacteroidota bacterium]
MRKATILMHDKIAGILFEMDNEYVFEYDHKYRLDIDNEPVSLAMPLSNPSYSSKILFPFFDGLIPEGWLLDIATNNWKLNARDRMGLLLACCKDCIGAVTVEPLIESENE